MVSLAGKIAVVAGASRGAGRGIALALGEAGATVYVVGRTTRGGPAPADGAPGTIEDTAEEVTARGGNGIPLHADLAEPAHVDDVFSRAAAEQGKIDVLANAVWSLDVLSEWSKRFWNLSDLLWRDTLRSMSACWLTSVRAARLMAKQRRGLIVHVTDNHSPDPSAYRGQILHDLGHEAINRLVEAMAAEAKQSRLAVVGLNPGFMRTERVLRHMTSEAIKKQFRFDLSESPEYIGRAVVNLAADPYVLKKTGKLLWVADLAAEYGFTDVDGRRIPRFDPEAPEQPMPC